MRQGNPRGHKKTGCLCLNCSKTQSINQSIKTHFYSAICRERIRGATHLHTSFIPEFSRGDTRGPLKREAEREGKVKRKKNGEVASWLSGWGEMTPLISVYVDDDNLGVLTHLLAYWVTYDHSNFEQIYVWKTIFKAHFSSSGENKPAPKRRSSTSWFSRSPSTSTSARLPSRRLLLQYNTTVSIIVDLKCPNWGNEVTKKVKNDAIVSEKIKLPRSHYIRMSWRWICIAPWSHEIISNMNLSQTEWPYRL